MQGLILAGGLGSRLAADGVQTPKALVPVAGVPQLERLCRTFEALGCETVTCMVRAGIAVDQIVPLEGRRRLIRCSTPTSLHTLVEGFRALEPGPVFCSMVDTVMPWNSWLAVWTAWEEASRRGHQVLLAVSAPSGDDVTGLYLTIDDSGVVTRFGGPPTAHPLVTAGVYGFGPRARRLAELALDRGIERVRGFLAVLAADGIAVRTVPVPRALDVDRRSDLEEANRWAPSVTP